MGRLLALIGALIGAALIAWAGERAPSPKPADAPATEFSATRAMADVAAIAPVPHPVGSPANAAARDYIVRRMTALGLSPQVRPGLGVYHRNRNPNVLVGGAVENIIGVLPGRDRTAPAVALMAHYDSVPASTGASDDAAGVASALEIVRAIKARGVPARDVMLVITDGEEAGLLGADAFYARDPLARHVGFVINMEARGSAGRAQMFQTGPQNGEAIRLMAQAAPRAQASSFTSYIYARMPNDTDLTVSNDAHLPGLNYAFIGHQFDYHSPSSVPATQDRGTLQDMGDQVLPTTAALAFATVLPKPAADLVYNSAPGGLLVVYPPALGWVVLAIAAGLIVLALWRARRATPFPWLDLARGAGAVLFAATTTAVVLHFARKATGVAAGFMEQRFLLAQAPRWELALILLALGVVLMSAAELARGRRKVALVPLLAGVGSCLIGGLELDKAALIEGVAGALLALAAYGRPASRPGAWSGVLLTGLVVAIVLQAVAPTAAFVIGWPVAWGAIAAAATDAASRRSRASIVLLAVLGAVGLAMAATFAHASFLSLDLPELLVMAVLMALPVMWPLAQPEEGAPPARLLGPVLVLVGLVVTLAVRFNDPYDARHPQAAYVAYEVKQDAKKAWRVDDGGPVTPWTRTVLTAGGGKIGKLDLGGKVVNAAPAPYVDMPAPEVSLAKAADGRLDLRVVPPPGARVLSLRLRADTPVTIESASGVPVGMPMKPGATMRVQWSAAPQGVQLALRPAGRGSLAVDYSAIVEQWPASVPPLPPRPAEVMPFGTSDSTVLEGARRFSW
jgi:hypothetical protein